MIELRITWEEGTACLSITCHTSLIKILFGGRERCGYWSRMTDPPIPCVLIRLSSWSSRFSSSDDSRKSWLCSAWTLGWWQYCVTMTATQLVFINIHSSQACETIHLKSESLWQEDSNMAAVGWHCYPRLVHHKPPHLTEAWRLMWWLNTRTAGSSHLVTWECKVICENNAQNIIRRALRIWSLLHKSFLLEVHSGLFPFSHSFFSFLSQEYRKTKPKINQKTSFPSCQMKFCFLLWMRPRDVINSGLG